MNEDPLQFSPDSHIETEPPEAPKVRRWLRVAAALFLLLLATLTFGYWYVISLNAPSDTFPVNQAVLVEAGTDVRTITEILEREGVVQSADLLYYTLAFLHDPTNIKASRYVFSEPLTTNQVASRLTEGDFDTDLVRFTHFEGERMTAIAERADEALTDFDKGRFLTAAANDEGRLFPDTYFLPGTFTDEELRALMLETYDKRIEPLRAQIESHPFTETEVIILASIIEREANSPESMRNVASVFQNRLEIGMALQADASIEYVVETPLGELPPGELAENLRELDSPYNTYLYPGLPPGPIGNPGLDSINAVLNPADTEYFYYLTADDGTFYYAETYDEHLTNIERYLR